tara:strand:+ start:49 stop:504 length:456 start_codon:yes stop_codon:yes gene_type:complete
MKKIFLIMLIFFVSGCGYSSIYKNQSQNFQINIETMDGDNEFNNFIKNELKLYSNLSSQKIYLININSNYKKIDIAKDSSGVTSNYKLSILTNINVKLKDVIKNFQFKETINIKKNTNSFEQNNYERNIKRNFASLIREKLIIELLNINDN